MATHFLTAVFLPATPFFGHSDLILLLFLVLLTFFGRLVVTQPDEQLEQVVNAAIRDCLQRSHIAEKQAADLMGMQYSHFQKALRNEQRYYISLTRLLRLPFVFWLWFLPDLSYVIARLRLSELASEIRGREHV